MATKISLTKIVEETALLKFAYAVQSTGDGVTNGQWNQDWLRANFNGFPNAELLINTLVQRFTPLRVEQGPGISMVAVRDNLSQQVKIVADGTELPGANVSLSTTFRDLLADASVLLGIDAFGGGSSYSSQVSSLRSFTTSVAQQYSLAPGTIQGIGHSLSGNLIAKVSYDPNSPIGNLSLYQAPGFLGLGGTALDMLTFGLFRPDVTSTNIIIPPDIVPSAGYPIGQMIVLGDLGLKQPLAGHLAGLAALVERSVDLANLGLTNPTLANTFAAVQNAEQIGAFATVSGQVISFAVINGVRYAVSDQGGVVDGYRTISVRQALEGQRNGVIAGADADLARLQAITPDTPLVAPPSIQSQLGAQLGSQLGMLVGGDNPFEQVATGTLLGAIGASLGQWAGGDLAAALRVNGDGVAAAFGANLGASFQDTSTSVVSSYLTNKLLGAAGIQGFGGELANVVVNQAVRNGIVIALDEVGLLSGSPGNLLTGTTGAITSFLGAKLAQLVVSPQTQAGQVLGSLGGTVGSIMYPRLFQAIGMWGGPIGAFVGTILGTLIGNLFGSKKPKPPQAQGDTVLDFGLDEYRIANAWQANGGNLALATDMASAAAQTLNQLMDLIGGRVANAISPTQTYGHLGNQVYVKFAGTTTNVSSPDEAVDAGVLWAIRQTQLAGGDIFLKRALANSVAPNVVALLADIQVAASYSHYRTNWVEMNDLLSSQPNSGFTAGWIQTFARANELKITDWSRSDFFGGLKGFIDSFGLAADNMGYEDIRLSSLGGTLTVSAVANGLNSGFFSILPGASADGLSVSIANFTSGSLGYTPWSSVGMGGANFIDASGAGVGQFIQDVGSADGSTGGDDIELGSAYADTMQGNSGRDWLDGGAGDDILRGGADGDVVLGGDGNDQLFGDKGDDFLAGGAGNDSMLGGDGADTFSGKAGMDTMSGEAGDDVFVVNADNGATYDYMDGGAGNDLLSYERFDKTGVAIDLSGTSYYGDAWTSIEGVIGSQLSDTLTGTSANNTLRGGAGDDLLFGGDGDDLLEGGRGSDQLNGGNGFDTVTYERSLAAVNVDLTTLVAWGDEATGDKLQSIEGVIGSAGADTLRGSDATSNVIAGGDGDDILIATAGADTYDGGNGFDYIDFSRASAGVALQLGSALASTPFNGAGNGGIANGHTYISVEAVVGSKFADYLVGAIGDQLFDGGQGDDQMFGGGGSDTYIYGKGYGQDQISDDNTASNVLSLTGVKYSDLAFGTPQVGTYPNLEVILLQTGEKITVNGNFHLGEAAGNVIKYLNIDGVGSIDIGAINYGSGGGNGADALNGFSNRADWLMGYDGNDTLRGAVSTSGADAWENNGNVMIGGTGDDVITTSVGDDQFVFERGDGFDRITDADGEDTIVFGPSVSSDDLIYEVSGQNLYIGLKDASNPALKANQVADRILVVGGATKILHVQTGVTDFDPRVIEYVSVGGASIDLRKIDITWTRIRDDTGGPINPIIFDLNGDGLDLSPVSSSPVVVKGDDGALSTIGWAGPTEGVLVVDRNGDGKIDRVSEISFTQDKPGATSDLEGLRTWDSNGDGTLDARDERFGELMVWTDLDQNGQSSQRELKALKQAGLASIDLTGQSTGITDRRGDSFVQNTLTATRSDGSKVDGFDVALAAHALGPNPYAHGVSGDGLFGALLNDPLADAEARAGGGPITNADAEAAAKVDFSGKANSRGVARWANNLKPGRGVVQFEGGEHLPELLAARRNEGRPAKLDGADVATGSEALAQPLKSPAATPELQSPYAETSADTAALATAAVAPLSLPLLLAPAADGAAGSEDWWRGLAPQSLGYAEGEQAFAQSASYDGVQPVVADTTDAAAGDSIDSLRQQQLLRQAIAGFVGDTGGSPAVWNRGPGQMQGDLAISPSPDWRVSHQQAA